MRKLFIVSALILLATPMTYALVSNHAYIFVKEKTAETNSLFHDYPDIVHRSTVTYNANIMTTHEDGAIFAGQWKNNSCTDIKKLSDWHVNIGMQQGWELTSADTKDTYPKGYTCGVDIINVGGKTFRDVYQLITDSEGNYIKSNPFESDYVVN